MLQIRPYCTWNLKPRVFLIDGFNLYHSLEDASRLLGVKATKWLNIHSLCSSYLHLIGNNAQISGIYYFSALALHYQFTNPDKIERHKKYIRCLESTGIIVKLGRFKSRPIICKVCYQKFVRHEEKETDVAIATKLLELSYANLYDTVVLVTGDTDLSPAVMSVQKNFINKKIIFAFPYKRKNQELADLAPSSFSIGCNNIVQHQFPNPVVLKEGTEIYKPDSW